MFVWRLARFSAHGWKLTKRVNGSLKPQLAVEVQGSRSSQLSFLLLKKFLLTVNTQVVGPTRAQGHAAPKLVCLLMAAQVAVTGEELR